MFGSCKSYSIALGSVVSADSLARVKASKGQEYWISITGKHHVRFWRTQSNGEKCMYSLWFSGSHLKRFRASSACTSSHPWDTSNLLDAHYTQVKSVNCTFATSFRQDRFTLTPLADHASKSNEHLCQHANRSCCKSQFRMHVKVQTRRVTDTRSFIWLSNAGLGLTNSLSTGWTVHRVKRSRLIYKEKHGETRRIHA